MLSLLLLLIFLPYAVEKQVNKILAGISRNGVLTVQVKHIGLFNSYFAFHAIKDLEQEEEALRILSCHLQYRPFRLFRRQLNTIKIEGARLRLNLDGEGEFLPLLELFPGQRPRSASDKPDAPRPLAQTIKELPVSFNHLLLNGDLLLSSSSERFPIACDLALHNTGDDRWAYTLEARNSLHSLKANGTWSLDKEELEGNLVLEGQSAFLPNSLKKKLPKELDFKLQGKAEYNLNLRDVKQSKLRVEIISPWHYARGGLKLGSETQVRLELQDGEALAEIPSLQGSYADYDFELSDANFALPLQGEPQLSGEFKLKARQQNLFEAQLTLQKSGDGFSLLIRPKTETSTSQFTFRHGDLSLDSSISDLQLALLLNKELPYQASLMLGATSLQQDELQVTCEIAKLELQGKANRAELNIDCRALLLQIGNNLEAQAPELSSKLSFDDGRAQGYCKLSQGKMQMRKHKLETEFTAELPIMWPLPTEQINSGRLDITRLSWQKVQLADLQGGFSFDENALGFTAQSQLCGMQAKLSTQYFPHAKDRQHSLYCRFELPEQIFDFKQLPKKLLPQLQEFQGHAKVAANVNYTYGASGSKADASLSLDNGELSGKEKKFALQGVKIDFQLPELPKLYSAGNQLFSFQSLVLNNIVVNSGELHFRMESPDTWHIEGLSLDWCEGNLKMESARVNLKNRHGVFNFHCDRLRLSSLLQQLGVGIDKGEGRISGSMPISFTDQGIRIHDAFLYSTPGETGSIKLRPGAGIKSGAATSTQLSFALAALANFDYEWVKLNMNSEKNSLKINLASNGRPLDKLYYAPKAGSLEHSTVANEFTGLLLNLNLSIPLESSIKFYKDLQRKIMPTGK